MFHIRNPLLLQLQPSAHCSGFGEVPSQLVIHSRWRNMFYLVIVCFGGGGGVSKGAGTLKVPRTGGLCSLCQSRAHSESTSPPGASVCLRKLVPLGSALSPLRWRGKLRRSWVEGVYKHKPRPLWPPSPPPPLHSARCTLTGAAARGLPLSHARQPAIWRSPHSPPGSAASGLAEPSLTPRLGWAASDLAGPSLTPLNQGTTDFLLFAC